MLCFLAESPRKDSDPDISAEASLSIATSVPSVVESTATSAPVVSKAGAELVGAVGGALPPTEGDGDLTANSGDGASSTGSEGRRAATAFTIDLDKEDDAAGSAKKLNIVGSLSKWAPKHRRNLSLSKVEENKVRYS